MRIAVAKSAGFCSGVKMAIKTALSAEKHNKKIDMFGDIVHNEVVVNQIKKSGINKISKMADGKNKILLIRAHGTAKDIYKKAKKLGYEIIDATCPMVREIHKIASEEENKGHSIIIIGDKNHDEVKGIAGQLKKKPLIINKVENIPAEKLKKIGRAAIVVQSTQDIEKVLTLVKKINKYVKNLTFRNTICNPTKMKQKEAKDLARKNDVMIIIGSKTSANTRRLFEISKSKNRKSHWVQSEKDIKKEWFRGSKSTGITAGASTPEETIQKVIRKIKSIT